MTVVIPSCFTTGSVGKSGADTVSENSTGGSGDTTEDFDRFVVEDSEITATPFKAPEAREVSTGTVGAVRPLAPVNATFDPLQDPDQSVAPPMDVVTTAFRGPVDPVSL